MNSFLQQIIMGQVRHWMTAAAGALVMYHLMKGDPTTVSYFVDISTDIAVGVLGMLWSGWQKSGHAIVVSIVKKAIPELPADAVPGRGVAI